MILYLHGFASGPSSAKGRALAERFATLGVPVERADLTPGDDGFERSTPLTMLAEAERLATRLRPRVLMGSSLGGYLAAVVASDEVATGTRGSIALPHPSPLPRRGRGGLATASSIPTGIQRLVLLAPAFRLFERWRARLSSGEERAWREQGLLVHHHASNRERRLGWAFMEDAARMPAFPSVTVPTLCIAGRRDEVVPLTDIEAFVARTPSARLLVLDDGHELVASIDRIFEEARAFLAPALR